MAPKKTEVGARDFPLNWDVLADARHSNRHERPGSGDETADVVADIVDTYLRQARRRPRRHLYHRRASEHPRRLGRGERQEPDNDLCHPQSRRPFLWHRSAPGSFSQCQGGGHARVVKLMRHRPPQSTWGTSGAPSFQARSRTAWLLPKNSSEI